MGNGASVSDDFQVFQLLKLEYDELKEYNPSYIDDDAGLAKRLSYVREACMNEHLLQFIECVQPSVLRQKYRQLTVGERAEYDNLVLTHSPTHSPTYSLTYSLTHLLTHSPTPSPTHSGVGRSQ